MIVTASDDNRKRAGERRGGGGGGEERAVRGVEPCPVAVLLSRTTASDVVQQGMGHIGWGAGFDEDYAESSQESDQSAVFGA
jgi:hypothetical protein